jgi:hypothetical protein
VNESQRAQVGRIISHVSMSSRAALALGVQGIETQFTRAGRPGSGAMACSIAERMARSTDLLISELVNKVAPVIRSPAAFAEIEVAVRQFLRTCDDDVKELSRTARSLRLQESPSKFLEVARRELTKVAESAERRLDIERFEFAMQSAEPSQSKAVPKGGRPPAEFWDELWAEIAARLYEGDLKPKSQAHIELAMTKWIEAQGRSAAVSTIRSRARRLWQRIEESAE